MQPPKQHSWINLVEMKGQLIKKIGLERSKLYLDYLNRFLSLKLSKAEFDKLCLKTIGKDNIRLHNQLIRSVLKNACTGKVGNKKPLDGIHHQNGPVSVVTQVTSPLTLVNGDILPPSPRKARTGVRKSAFGPNGKTNFTPFSSSSPNHLQEPLKQAESSDISGENHRKDSLNAPLGVPFCPVSIGGAHRSLPSGNNSKCVGVLHTDGLVETKMLKERMEQIAGPHGIQRVTMDCANVLNSGLDTYLKGLIRCVHNPTKSVPVKNPTHMRSLNGVGPNVMQEHEPKPKRVVTLLDFRVAMELNCKQHGEDWPVLLEKICIQDFEE